MGTVVNVLTARKRVEENQLLQSLALAGVPAEVLSPTSNPLPIGPVPGQPSAAFAVDGGFANLEVIVDRCQNRSVAQSLVPLLKATGAAVIDAGLAASGNRASIAAVLSRAGLPRPATYLVTSEEVGLASLEYLSYPSTYLPLTTSGAEITLLDRDTAEAVFEHRGMLGGAPAALGILQEGCCYGNSRYSVLVVDGRAVAVSASAESPVKTADAIGLAVAAARALDADILGVDIVATPLGLAIWDVNPVPDWRDLVQVGPVSPADAVAELAARRALPRETTINRLPLHEETDLSARLGLEVRDGVALTA
jgi:glutathione synthase/RimK-type ligase-like ATP-grasp enzyme